MPKPVVNHDLCIGCGTCESLCPNAFVMEEGKSHVTEGAENVDVQEAIDSCPVSAISMEE